MLAALLAAMCVTSTFAAEGVSVEDRLSALEKNLSAVQKENAELKKQLGWDGKTPLVVVKPNGKENRFKIGGFLHAHYETGDAPDARYNGIEDRGMIRRARINFAGGFTEQFDFKVEADLGAKSLAEATNYSAQLTDAFVNWNRYSFANVKFGQFKVPFGYEYLTPITRTLTVERSLASDRLTDGRQVGLAFWGDVITNRLNYNVGVFNGTPLNNSYNDNESYLWAGHVTGVAFDGKIADREARVAVGLSGLTTHDNGITKSGFGFAGNAFTGRRSSWGVDTQIKWWLFGLEGEYLHTEFKPVTAANFTADGWNVAASAEVWPKHLQALVKYETFNPNRSVSSNSSDVWTFGLNYFIKGNDLKLSLNYLLGNPAGALNDQGRLIARMQVIF